MIGSLGTSTLIAALLVAAATTASCVLAGWTNQRRWLAAAKVGLLLGALLTAVATALLGWALFAARLELAYVCDHIELSLSAPLRVAALWSGQEGSLLLWAAMTAAAGGLAAVAGREPGRRVTLAVISSINLFFAAILVFRASPFRAAAELMSDGVGLNPQLQHWAMVIHPPLVLMGYSLFAVPFAMACGALASNNGDRAWVGRMRRWVVAAWMCLGAGMVLGAWWAYVELGWGGYWAWDPVENASLMPWLIGTALLHTIGVHTRRGRMARWTPALAVVTYSLCVFGAYLTRSGVVQSVHAFAASPVGDLLLGLLGMVVFVGITLLCIKGRRIADRPPIADAQGLISVRVATLANVLLLMMAAGTLAGTIFPLVSGWLFTTPVGMGQGYFNRMVAPLGVGLLALMAVSPLLPDIAAGKDELRRRLGIPSIATALAIGTAVGAGVRTPLLLLCVVIGTFAVTSIAAELGSTIRTHARHTGFGLGRSVLMVLDGNHRRLGSQLAHAGIALVLIGVSGSSLLSQAHTVTLVVGQSAPIGERKVRLDALREIRGDTYTAAEADVWITDRNGDRQSFRPQRRYYDRFPEPTGEVSLRTTLRRDVYVAMVGWNGRDRRVSLHIYESPLVVWIWIGGAMITLAGGISLLPRLLPPHKPAETAWDTTFSDRDPLSSVPSSEQTSRS